jgi:hypothetical protein
LWSAENRETLEILLDVAVPQRGKKSIHATMLLDRTRGTPVAATIVAAGARHLKTIGSLAID